jgi:hypothetical protein
MDDLVDDEEKRRLEGAYWNAYARGADHMRRQRVFYQKTAGSLGGVVADTTYSISGTVYDADGTTAVASATIALGAYNATSAANGTYTISSIPAGTSGSMTCTKSGYSWTAKTIAEMSGNLTGQNYTNAWWAVGGISASAIGIYRAIGAASYAASKVNVVTPGTHDLTTPNDPAWTSAGGWAGGSPAHLRTDIVPGQDWTMMIRFSGAPNNTYVICGSQKADNTQKFLILNDGTAHNGTEVSTSSYAAESTYCLAGLTAYRGGANARSIASSVSAPGYPVYILADNSGGSAVYHSVASCLAFVIYNITLNSGQVAALHAAISALTG